MKRLEGHGTRKYLLRALFSTHGVLIGLILLVCLAVVVGHWPSLGGSALLFDDDQYIIGNSVVCSPGWPSIRRSFVEVLEPSTVRGYYQPLSMISLMADYALGGRPDHQRPFHRTSLALHALNTALVSVLLYLLFGNPWTAAMLGLLFGLHPLTVEAISWTAERKTLLAAFFSLGCLVLYVRHARRGCWRAYAGCIAMYIFSLLSKPTGTPLPFLLLLIDYWPLQRERRALREKVPFLFVAVLFGAVTCISQSRTSSMTLCHGSGPLHVLWLVCYEVVFYLYKIIWPANLSPYYGHPPPFTLSDPTTVVSVTLICLLLLLTTITLWWTRGMLTGLLLFVVALFPTMGIISFSDAVVAHRHVYFPSVGVLIMLGSFLTWFWHHKNFGPRSMRRTAILAIFLSCAAVETVATRMYLVPWRNTLSLYEHMLTVSPNAIPVHNNLAVALSRQGRMNEAISHLRRVVALCPNSAEAYNNLGMAFRAQGRLEEAIWHFGQALRLAPRSAVANSNMGIALAMKGQYNQAFECFLRASRLRPEAVLPWKCLAHILITHCTPGTLETDRAFQIVNQAIEFADYRSEATLDELAALYHARHTAEGTRRICPRETEEWPPLVEEP